jgi:hypothetical protein
VVTRPQQIETPPATTPRRPIRLRSPLSRAVVPVLAGIVALAAIGLVTWAFAAYISRDGAQTSERLAPSTFQVGSTQNAARIVAEDGPILFPGLNTTTGERTLVLDHVGDDPTTGWAVYMAYPAGGEPSCAVEQVVGTSDFISCDGTMLDVTELAPPPPGVNPVVENQRILVLDLRGLTGS